MKCLQVHKKIINMVCLPFKILRTVDLFCRYVIKPVALGSSELQCAASEQNHAICVHQMT